MFRLTAFLLSCGLAAFAAETYCDAPSEVQTALRQAAAVWDSGLTIPKQIEARRAILESLVKRFPDDIQANRRYQNDAGIPKEELIATYRKRLDAQPGDALSIYFYALVLATRDAPEGMRLFRDALQRDPSLAWPHMALAYYYASGPLADKTKATEEVDAFFTKCPTSYDFYTNRMLGSHASPALRKKVTEALRQRVAAEPDPEKLGIYEHLWALEFRTTPPAEHPALRTRVAADLRRIQSAVDSPPLALLRVMRDGMRQAGNPDGASAVEDEMLKRFPASSEAPRIAQERWRKQHPAPGPNASQEERRAWARVQYAKAGEWTAQWPGNAIARLERFGAARILKDLPAAEMKASADALLDLLRGNDAVYGFQPFEHQTAEEYLERGIYVELVPALAEAGVATVERRVAEQMKDAANLPKEVAKLMQAPLPAARIAAVELLAQAALRQRQADTAAALESRLAAVIAVEPREQAAWMRAASYVAELAGRKLDAFVYQEKALELAPAPNPWQKEAGAAQRERLRTLWTAAGGSEKTWAMRGERKAAVQEAKADSDWAKPEKAVPAWQMEDLTGRKWSSGELAGKVVLVNLWATWCGPCRAEHPHFQKLYDKLKDRPDVVVLSFNVDDQVGLVQGYLNEGKYTFPTLLAKDFVNRHTDLLSIPQNWLFDAQGVHRLTQQGFGTADGWEQMMLKALERVKEPAK